MTYTINVTQKDIDNGGRSGCDCPIARALHRQWHDLAWVGFTEVCIEEGIRPRHVAELPPAAVHFISRLHDNERVKPFTFTIDLPEAQ